MSAFTKRKAVAFAAIAAIPFSLAVSAPAFAATTNVTTWDQLKAAFDAAPLGAVGDPIKLDADIVSEDGERLVVPHSQGNDGAAIVFDLAGHSLDITALAGSEAAAIGVFDGASLLVIDSVGGGELTATGADYGAGIGADATDPDDYGWGLGDVAIEGGTINATGGDYAAGIGNAYYSTGGHVTIRGGDVTATGGYEAAGIGGAYYTGFYDRGDRATASVDILGGTVDASGGRYAAGIGGGYSGSYGAVVNIKNATVTATGSEGGSGIGGGFSAEKGAPITITGSTVVATGSTYSSNDGGTPNDFELYGGAGIGEGAGQYQSTDTTVLITDSDVTAVGGTHAAGIGTGSFYDSDQQAVRSLQGVAILNSRVKATGGGGAAGIGGAQGQPGTEVQIGHGSLVTAKGGSSDAAGGGAGIGAGANYSDSPAPGAGTLRLEGAAQLGASTTAGNGSGVDRDEALDSIGGDAATLVGDDSDFVWNAVSVDGQAAGDGGSTDISWVTPGTPVSPAADPTTPALAETGSGAVAPGLAIGGLLMAAGAALVLRRRVRAKA